MANGESLRVLDPVDRVMEVMFGLLMAMTFVGALSVATAGQEEVRTMMVTALGCNLAWGLADAVMYLVRTVTERTRNRTLLARLRGAMDAPAGQALVADALPAGIAAVATSGDLEALRRRIVERVDVQPQPRLHWNDLKGALGVFLLVVAATFPVVIPFMVFNQTAVALRTSNVIAIVMLFIAGALLARYAGGAAWRGGLAMAATGVALLAAIMALGG
jgi:VIT1/CCC1 family predicted Fe2+/Mn2+ transporter